MNSKAMLYYSREQWSMYDKQPMNSGSIVHKYFHHRKQQRTAFSVTVLQLMVKPTNIKL